MIADADLIEMYRSGMSLKAISLQDGRSHQYVYRLLKKRGIDRRPAKKGGPLHSQWTGGRLSAGLGYWRQWVSASDPMASMRTHQGYVLEHRLAMARKLGRPLLRSETVHHVDGDRSNNAVENLQLRQGKHGSHIAMVCRCCGSHDVVPAPLA